jgi:poly(hydroxyalkanoate) depolymerase family esterase
MLKAFNKLWRKSAKRLVKAQLAQQKKINKVIIKKVLAPVTLPRAALKSVTPLSLVESAQLGYGGTWSRGYVTSTQTLNAQVRRLNHWLFVPDRPIATSLRQQKPMPLVVMLHGCEQNAVDFATGTYMNRLAARYGFAVLYPQQSITTNKRRCWAWYQLATRQGLEEVSLIAGAIEQVMLRHPIDQSRIYAAGLSAGAAMAQALALFNPHIIAAVGSHSGPVFGVANSTLQAVSVMHHGSANKEQPVINLLSRQSDFPTMPIMIVHGAQDAIVKPINSIQLAHQFCVVNHLSSNRTMEVTSYPAQKNLHSYRLTDHMRNGKALVRLCEVSNLGHAWSGGNPLLPFNIAKGPNASALLWQFFKQHQRLSV